MLPFFNACRRRTPQKYLGIINHRWYPSRRHEATARQASESNRKVETSLFIDSIFPVQLGIWDLRHYLAALQEKEILDKLGDILRGGVNGHGFELSSIEPRSKDGGVFVNFSYILADAPKSNEFIQKSAVEPSDHAFLEIKESILKSINFKGGLPSWLDGISRNGTLWQVRGKPWKEDLRLYASPLLRVFFDGPDIGEERLWEILRPYGRIRALKPSGPVAAGSPRSVLVSFDRLKSATIAHNCIHGACIPSPWDPNQFTILKTVYEQPINSHAIRNWVASHPRIVLPIVVFLIGTLTYTVFDPIRALVVQAKTMGWLDLRKFAVVKWLPLDRLAIELDVFDHKDESASSDTNVWQDRKEATDALNNYLSDLPTSATFLYGPAGSGKSRLTRSVLEHSDRPTVIINCSEIFTGNSNAKMVKSLAEQTGYWPIFSFLDSFNHMIDLASVGLIGQKAGLSSSLEEQVTQVLHVVTQGLRRVDSSRRKQASRHTENARKEEEKIIRSAEMRERIRRGTWHDGRIDCVAGNGVMSELGIGIENFDEKDEDQDASSNHEINDKVKREREYIYSRDVKTLPVVVIKNFVTGRSANQEQISAALADWAADLVNNKIAHVVVLSDNRENGKRLAKAFPTKPLNVIALGDADLESSLSYVKQKLKDGGTDYTIPSEEASLIERTGGRANDLDTIIHKVRSGQSVTEAVEDIIQRDVAELRKKAFGDDTDDAKGLKWTRQQAWTIVKLLARQDKLLYYPVLLESPFKGDETALRAMENADIISIMTVNGRPSTIFPGRPIDRYAFQKLVEDEEFQIMQDIALHEQFITEAASNIKSAEDELLKLKKIPSQWLGSAVSYRMQYLLNKMNKASMKIEDLEEQNERLKIALRRQKRLEDNGRWWIF